MGSRRLAVLECYASERRLASYFFRIVAETLVPEAAVGIESRFEAAVDTVISLFKALQQPGSRTIQGLWAALAMIAYSTNPQVALSSWHSNPRALHDFASGVSRLEVKSTLRDLREHTFLLDQLILGGEGAIVIASLILREIDGGCSIFNLVAAIKARLSSPEAKRRLDTIVADALGAGIAEVDDHMYDLDGARMSLCLFQASDVPRTPAAPPEVKDVSFTADLSTTRQLPLEDARRISTQFADLLPLPV